MSWLLCDNCETPIDNSRTYPRDNPEAYDDRTGKWWCDKCFPDYEKDDGVYAK